MKPLLGPFLHVILMGYKNGHDLKNLYFPVIGG